MLHIMARSMGYSTDISHSMLRSMDVSVEHTPHRLFRGLSMGYPMDNLSHDEGTVAPAYAISHSLSDGLSRTFIHGSSGVVHITVYNCMEKTLSQGFPFPAQWRSPCHVPLLFPWNIAW